MDCTALMCQFQTFEDLVCRAQDKIFGHVRALVSPVLELVSQVTELTKFKNEHQLKYFFGDVTVYKFDNVRTFQSADHFEVSQRSVELFLFGEVIKLFLDFEVLGRE